MGGVELYLDEFVAGGGERMAKFCIKFHTT